MSELKKHHINEAMDMHNLTRGELGYSYVYYVDDADRVIAEKDAEIAELKEKLEGAKNETNYWCNNLKVFAQKKDAEIAELKASYKEACDRLQTVNLIKDGQKAKADELLMKVSGLEKLVETADNILKEKGGFTVKDVTFKGVKVE